MAYGGAVSSQVQMYTLSQYVKKKERRRPYSRYKVRDTPCIGDGARLSTFCLCGHFFFTSSLQGVFLRNTVCRCFFEERKEALRRSRPSRNVRVCARRQTRHTLEAHALSEEVVVVYEACAPRQEVQQLERQVRSRSIACLPIPSLPPCLFL